MYEKMKFFLKPIWLFKSHKHSRFISVFSNSIDGNGRNNVAWQKAISNAEKIVGFPTSFLSLRALLSDELQGMAGHLKKFVETKHPLLKTARGILFDSKNFLQTRGLIVLLISKCASTNSQLDNYQLQNSAHEIYTKQRSLAEITELINLGFLIHRGLIDVDTIVKENKVSKSDMEIGNKIAVLGGDFLLANATSGLSKLKNTKVVELMSNTVSEMSAGFFVLPENDEQLTDQAINDLPNSVDEWEKSTFLSHGSLLSNSCKSALHLGNYDDQLCTAAGNYGKYFALAQQSSQDIHRYDSISSLLHKPCSNSICTLPVVVAISNNLIDFNYFLTPGSKNDQTFKVDHKKIYKFINNNNNILEESKHISNHYVSFALDSLNLFSNSKVKQALKRIAQSVSH